MKAANYCRERFKIGRFLSKVSKSCAAGLKIQSMVGSFNTITFALLADLFIVQPQYN